MKKIVDIRLLEEAKPSRSLPDYAGTLYLVTKDMYAIGERFARKLRELDFVAGEADHIYVVMTPLLEEKEVRLSDRQVEKRIKLVYVGVVPEWFNKQADEEKEQTILELVNCVLESIAIDTEQKQRVQEVYALMQQRGSELEIIHLIKETRSYRVTLSYQIKPLGRKSAAIAEYVDLKEQTRRKGVFLELDHYEDIFLLASSLAVKNGRLELKPRTSRVASYRSPSYSTPVSFPVASLPLQGEKET